MIFIFYIMTAKKERKKERETWSGPAFLASPVGLNKWKFKNISVDAHMDILFLQ